MYNPELKQEFISKMLGNRIESKTVAVTTINAYFSHAGEFEDRFGKDLSRFSHDEIIEMLKATLSRSSQSLKNRILIYKQYSDFAYKFLAEQNNCEYMNSYMLLTSADVSRCVSSSSAKMQILSRREIDNLQDKLPNAVDKALVECLFMGISGKLLVDLTSLTEEHLDYNNKCIIPNNGVSYSLNDKQVDMLKAAFDETESASLGGIRTVAVEGKGRIYKERPNAHEIATAERKFRWVQRKIDVWKDILEIEVLTPKTICMSGLVHELKIVSRDESIPLRPYLRTEEGELLAKRYGYTTRTYPDIIAEKVKDYLAIDSKI